MDKKEIARRARKSATDLANPVSTAKNAGRALKKQLTVGNEPMSKVIDGFRAMLRREREVEKLPTNSTDAHERFEFAMAYFSRSAEGIRHKQNQTAIMSALYATLAVALVTATQISALYNSGELARTLPFLGAAGVAGMLLVRAVEAAHENFQLRDRALYGYGRWLARPSEWLPRFARRSA